ncbi:hypothetical protein G7Z17_g551 [Cylindrodendrum hubeiense]|uniref:Uncharacterized protein n=1 Tax=Cylindrodendrum hubeiense TaxID=595255 RepID=A0A9P5HN18_9HYPO|nr:hypothetical protein G7Z17_g551 [Cylindrodendrum hubeiense]
MPSPKNPCTECKGKHLKFRLHTNPQGPAQRIAPEINANPVKTRRDEIQIEIDQSTIALGSASPPTPNSATGLGSSASDGTDAMVPSPLALEQPFSDQSAGYRNGLSPVLPALSHQGPSWGAVPKDFERKREEDQTQEAIQEACLLRYYVNELSHWVNSAVEYMLKCIPVLKEFHETRDEKTRELIVTTAVILRQFEEMEDEDDEESNLGNPDGEYNSTPIYGRVNFLAILNAVLRSSNSAELVHRLDLLNASYWIALRQEVYFALRKGYAPQMVEPPVEWADISPENKLVIHTSQVAKWRFDDKSEAEWHRAKGEVFPAIWYSSTMALTGMQHLMVAKMILTAESPFLGRHHPDARLAFREAEGEVRSLVLDVCGMALQHPGTAPAIVSAALAIQLYGSYFTDPWERKALRGIVQRFKDKRAWPVPKALQIFR